MTNLYFKNSKGKERCISRNIKSMKAAFEKINDFLNEHNFKSYYTNVSWCDDFVRFDVGSHTEFFYLRPTKKSKETCELKEIIEKWRQSSSM